MGILDKSVISAALLAHPALRANLRALLKRLSGDAFGDAELGAVERELMRALKLKEVGHLPRQLPESSRPICLSLAQLHIVTGTVSRFRDPALRLKCQAAIKLAIERGDIVGVSHDH